MLMSLDSIDSKPWPSRAEESMRNYTPIWPTGMMVIKTINVSLEFTQTLTRESGYMQHFESRGTHLGKTTFEGLNRLAFGNHRKNIPK